MAKLGQETTLDPTSLPLFAPEARQQEAPAVHETAPVAPATPEPAAAVQAFTDRSDMDWLKVSELREMAARELGSQLGEERTHLTQGEEHELGRSIILRLVQDEAAERAHRGESEWTRDHQRVVAKAVFDAVFRLGRLQPLVDDDTVENIIIMGSEPVWLERTDGRLEQVAPVADSDEELIAQLQFLATRSSVNARTFSESRPSLHMRLDGGARLAATAWVTPRPSVVIRRHRLQRVALEDLVDRKSLTPVAASFLRAAVKAGLTICVAGRQGAGKTTLVRALCAEIPPHEAIGTFETEYELHLHEQKDRHPIVHAWEARPGSGEIRPDGSQAGEFTLDEALVDSFRFNLSRQIVGEVRGKEVMTMFKAIESGGGSLSTTHSRDATGAIHKLITCAMESGPHVTEDYATRVLASSMDLVVFQHLETTPAGEGTFRRERWVSEILAVHPGEKSSGIATTHVFSPSPGGGPCRPGTLPQEMRHLEHWGFDLQTYLAQGGGG